MIPLEIDENLNKKQDKSRKNSQGIYEDLNNKSDLDEGSPLILDSRQKNNFCYRLKNIFYWGIDKSERIIYLDGVVMPPNNKENLIRNQKYSFLTILPLVLYNQFKMFFNLFYLLITLSQFVPALKIGFLFTYIAPLGFVLLLTFLKEAYDDFKRYQKDREANSFKYNVYNSNGQKQKKSSSSLKVGDIVEIKSNERVPADLLLLYTSESNGSCFVRTDQLDGETDWKLRRAVRYTQHYFERNSSFVGLNSFIQSSPPQTDIYEYTGVFKIQDQSAMNSETTEPLNLENTLWSNTVLANGVAIGLVLFVGVETRSAMNSRKPTTKLGVFDQEINYISKLIFLMMIILSSATVIMNGLQGQFYIQFFRYVLLLSCMIPISLRVNLDFAKAIFSYRINSDQDIPGTLARNSAIPEELGRVEYLLSDKTGTLTKNDMIFKKLSLENVQYTNEDFAEIQRTLDTNCEKYDGPFSDIHEKVSNYTQYLAGKTRKIRRENSFILRDIFNALVLCHNVTPTEENGIKTYQASSPDEVALVKYADSMKMKLLQRTQDEITIETTIGKVETYKVLAIFPFTSETKRMGILLNHVQTNKYVFYLKGADTVMQLKLKDVYKSFVLDECDSLAREGLRTLVVAQKYITESEYQEWKVTYDKALKTLTQRNKAIRDAADLLEKDLDFLGITGVEDKLQDKVSETIESLRNAGVKVWMLTGDKVETAKCIAVSTGLKSVRQDIFEIKDTTDELELHNKLLQYSNKINTVLLIDGNSLSLLLAKHQQLFFEISSKAPSVVCCRCLPTQKALIAEGIRKFIKRRVAAVGDGGNDVGMIQAGDLGIGIVGKEGNQASLASDFSILEFKYLRKLILWHGRSSYKRSSVLSQFVIHRGLVITVNQLIFTCVFYFVAIPIYNGWLMLGYATIYTCLPVFCLIFDEDVTLQNVMNFPQLYLKLQKGRELNNKTFLVWVAKSLYQGAVIMFLSLYLFENSFLDIITITFTSLIFSELLNVYSQLHKIHPIMIISQIGTIIVYILSVFLLNTYINIKSFSVNFFIKVMLITSMSWVPVHFIRKLVQCLDPAEDQKINATNSI